jgi:hypothetical protein
MASSEASPLRCAASTKRSARKSVRSSADAVPRQAAIAFGPIAVREHDREEHHRECPNERDAKWRLAVQDARDDEEHDHEQAQDKAEHRAQALEPSCHQHERGEDRGEHDQWPFPFEVGELVRVKYLSGARRA